MERQICSVSQINGLVKEWLAQNISFNSVCVMGEVSNYKLYPSGHHYFTLKDAASSLSCVMFKGNAAGLRFRPVNGMSVIASGRLSVYERDGKYQLQCSAMMPAGEGALQLAFEKLKEELSAAGFFDQEKKKNLPVFPGKIAVITSPVGAAVRDMIRILGERWPMADVIVVPVRVQGDEAADEISKGIDYVNRNLPVDLIITGRGGGSAEDLWCFNDERVARAIFSSKIPVISAVGHEPDITISDYVADRRAATPSNAAEIAVPSQEEIRRSLDHISNRISIRASAVLSSKKNDLDHFASLRILKDPHEIFNYRRMLIDSLRDSVLSAESEILSEKKQRLIALSSAIDAMSPLKVLARGYSFVSDKSGRTVKAVAELKNGENVLLNFADGTAECTVNSRELK